MDILKASSGLTSFSSFSNLIDTGLRYSFFAPDLQSFDGYVTETPCFLVVENDDRRCANGTAPERVPKPARSAIEIDIATELRLKIIVSWIFAEAHRKWRSVTVPPPESTDFQRLRALRIRFPIFGWKRCIAFRLCWNTKQSKL